MNTPLSTWRRRKFLKACAATAVSSALPSASLLALNGAHTEAQKPAPGHPLHDAVQNVLPAIGTGWRGHLFPGAVAPFGLVQLSPDTAGPPEPRWDTRADHTGWNHDSGYHFPDNVIVGFSHTHLQGTRGGDLGDVRLMPLVEGKNWAWEPGIPPDQALMRVEALGQNSGWLFDDPVPGYRSFFSSKQETMHAGYYAVHLQTPGIHAELTATTRCGMHRYSYPKLPAWAARSAPAPPVTSSPVNR
jgi:putative alpha-1,2-mannosidase